MDALEEVHQRTSHSHEESERILARLYQVVRQRALRVPVTPFTPVHVAVGTGWPPGAGPRLDALHSDTVTHALHQVEEPGRSALALVLLDAVEVESIEKILGLSIPQLAESVDRARASVAQALGLNGVEGSR